MNLEGHYLGPEDYTIEDYITNVKEMIGQTLKDNAYASMPSAELEKFLKNIAGYINVIKKKAEKLNLDYAEKKSQFENKEIQGSFSCKISTTYY